MQKVLVATPTYDGKTWAKFTLSLLDSVLAAARARILVNWRVMPGMVYVDMARNKLVREFLASDADDLVFIDADQAWPAEAFVRLLGWDKDVVGAVPPMKRRKQGRDFPVALLYDGEGRPRVEPETGLLRAAVLGTGMLRIRRCVFEKMLAEVGEDELLVIENNANGTEAQRYFEFFSERKDGTRKFGEDVHFSRLWRSLGGKLWVDPDVTFEHWGTYEWAGNLHEHLQSLPGGGGGALGMKPWDEAKPVDGPAAEATNTEGSAA